MSTESDEDKEVVLAFLEAWSDGDLDKAFALTDPDGTVWMLAFGEDIRMSAWTDRIRTKAANLQQGTRYVVEMMTSEEGRVSVIARGSSILADGTSYANRYHFLFHLAEGHIVRVMEFSDTRLADAAFRGGRQVSFDLAT